MTGQRRALSRPCRRGFVQSLRPHLCLGLLGCFTLACESTTRSTRASTPTTHSTRSTQKQSEPEAQSAATTTESSRQHVVETATTRTPSCDHYKSARVRKRLEGDASYYADSLAGNKTASGEPYDPERLSAAHRHLAFGTVLRVTDTRSQKTTCVVVNDRGPFGKTKRIVDLSRKAAEELDLLQRGVGRVVIEVLEVTPQERRSGTGQSNRK